MSWNLVARLGANAFRDMNWWAANTALIAVSNRRSNDTDVVAGLDVTSARYPDDKPKALHDIPVITVHQKDQLRNPDARITTENLTDERLLSEIADYGKGSASGDRPRFIRCFWEFNKLSARNVPWLDSADLELPWVGREHVSVAPVNSSEVVEQLGCRIHGQEVWGRPGVAVNKMRRLQPFLYAGEVFDDNIGVIAPHDHVNLIALWCYVASGDYLTAIRRVDQKVNVTAATLVKVPFDLAHWQQVAAEKYPNGLPKPYSSDPTQWLFDGYPAGSDDPLQVAVARLLGYRWPRQTGSSFPDCPALGPDGLESLADRDGIVGIPAVRAEAPAAERVLELLRVSCQLSVVSCQLSVVSCPLSVAATPTTDHGPRTINNGPLTTDNGQLTTDNLHQLLSAAGCKSGTTLDDWLRNSFFEQHCRLFHNRPFIWQIWDGRKDGFSCLVNYHTLDHVRLESLTYSYLGDWIRAQADDARAGKPGADLRLAAAQSLQEKLKLILAGEPPHDIFVRWKPLSEQAIGWNPDLNDGVRMNIRPFVEAGILRKAPNIKWTKDRGKEPERNRDEYPWFWNGDDPVGDRVNDVHIANDVKQAARNILSVVSGPLSAKNASTDN